MVIKPTADRVRKLFDYNAIIGTLTRLIPRGGHSAGTIAGNPNVDGYLQVMVDGWAGYVHQIAWLHGTGQWPTGQIDHIDGNNANNSLGNLRDVDQCTNMQNLKTQPRGCSTGILGASISGRRFRACIRVNGKFKHLGRYNTPEEAHAVYIAAKRIYHPGNTL